MKHTSRQPTSSAGLDTPGDAGGRGDAGDPGDSAGEAQAHSRSSRRASLGGGSFSWATAVLALVLLAIAVRGPGDLMTVATTATIFGVAGVGLTVLAGPARIVNLGASSFIGVGAFTTAYVNNVFGLDFLLSLCLSMLFCVILGSLVAPIASRLAGVYIAIITVGLAFLAQYVFRIAGPWTGGTSGAQLTKIPFFGVDLSGPVQLGSVVLDRSLVFFVLCAVVLLIAVRAASRLLGSRVGRALHVVGTSSTTARSFGISPSRYRSTALVFSAALCGLAGGLLAGEQTFVSWEQFDLVMSIDLIAVVVLGGLGSVHGAVVGSAILYTLPELVERYAAPLPFVSVGATGAGLSAQQLTAVLYGAALILVMVLEPRGLAALAGRASDRLRHRAAST